MVLLSLNILTSINIATFAFLYPVFSWYLFFYFFIFNLYHFDFIFLFFHLYLFFYFFPFIFIIWRLITLQYCSGFCHTLTWISHGFTCIPHPDPPSHLPLYPILLGLPNAPGPSSWGDKDLIPRLGRSPGEGSSISFIPVFLPGKSHRWRSLATFHAGAKASNTT